MEIVDYLRIARRRLWILVGVPLLGAALALAYVLASPRPSVVTVYVSAPSMMGSQYGTYQAQGASQFASNFVATASSSPVRDAVARETGASVRELEDGLSLEQVDLSSVVTITYTTREPSTAGSVATAVARQTLNAMFGSQVPVAQAAVDWARESVHDANEALAVFAEEHGSLPIAQQYETLTAQITVLENEEARFKAEGLTGSADVLTAKLERLRSKAAELAPLTTEQSDLLAQQEAATSTLTTSQQVLGQAQAQLAAVDPNQVQAPPVREVPLSRLLVTLVVPVAAVNIFWAIALVALLELVAQRRTETVRDRVRVSRTPLAKAPPAKVPVTSSTRRPVPREDLKRRSSAKAPATSSARRPVPRDRLKAAE